MEGKVVFNKRLNGKYYYMKVENRDFVRKCKPGQFFMLKTQVYDYVVDPLLRRPFGICDVDEDGFTLLYLLVGKGTSLLANIEEGTLIKFSEPLGNGFKLVADSKVALVGGGVGIAPLLYLAKELKKKNNEITLFYGGKSKDDIHLIDEFKKFCDEIKISTEDGTLGQKGRVTALLDKTASFDKVYCCGPKPMMKATVDFALENEIDIEVSLDEKMACGIGACLGCIIYIKEKNGIVQKRCCVEGPVFDGTKIAWERLNG
ncbi:dihydroorotate dehydrogenase electron transfer subunit [Deferribacter autotrophicus]|uniref:Dihydroorotate dehydrogenase B (NAD(+)), electron transfer subunit n=1 Tax=Deferribacter autotrophicus TaxID=500465 RepID=A0A5A8F0C5_9BACT|nr:dihydroorotate dehydrogenase electron transfer subunit [Deferribacter autotrophicus]KAA0257436.1 dihydroorotate dehydrogenase electron transfer subunit [Deferribacter autotrophicus]